jgi:hypothetical protein
MSPEEITFYIGLTGIGVGLIHYILRCVFKYKCEHCSLCYGLVDIQRETEQEGQNDAQRNSFGSSV